MRAAELKKILDKRPFEPVRLHISSGQHVDIRHPETAFLTRSTVVVGVDAEEGIADYAIHYNRIHIVKIEPLNGRRRRTTRRSR